MLRGRPGKSACASAARPGIGVHSLSNGTFSQDPCLFKISEQQEAVAVYCNQIDHHEAAPPAAASRSLHGSADLIALEDVYVKHCIINGDMESHTSWNPEAPGDFIHHSEVYSTEKQKPFAGLTRSPQARTLAVAAGRSPYIQRYINTMFIPLSMRNHRHRVHRTRSSAQSWFVRGSSDVGIVRCCSGELRVSLLVCRPNGYVFPKRHPQIYTDRAQVRS